MAEKDPEDKPSLELPSFSFGRKKDKGSSAEPAAAQKMTSATPSTPKREFSLATLASLPALPVIPALRAVLVVGALVGLLAVLLTFASLKFCELASGTDSCGGPGLLLLIATVVVLTYTGASLLRGFGIADAGSTSFLAVALLAVRVRVFLLDVIYSWWMILVVPLVSMAMYALSWWVTTSFVDTDDGRRRG